MQTMTKSILSLSAVAWLGQRAQAAGADFRSELPVNAGDFGQPDWHAIIETAFPPWQVPANGCPRLDKMGGDLEAGFETFPTPEAGKFNPCYYTKAFAGLDPMKGGYPTPVDTKYPYEFAAPFFKQPGDGSTHHCALNAPASTPVQSCPKVGTGGCGAGVKDCNKITDEFGIGHVPPFVPLAAVKNAFLSGQEDVCAWFDEDVHQCNIPKSVLDRLVVDTFEVDGFIKFTPPKILDDLPASDPKSTYYKLEYLGDPVACADNNCRGPHYCSKAAAEEDVWGDFCPYIHTGENAGLYRHPHVALAALELWMANKCKPTKCPSTWLDSPNAKDYGTDSMKSTSITWSEMDDNSDPMAQPTVPYKWPNAGDGIYPGHELYGGLAIKPAPGLYVNKYVTEVEGLGKISIVNSPSPPQGSPSPPQGSPSPPQGKGGKSGKSSKDGKKSKKSYGAAMRAALTPGSTSGATTSALAFGASAVAFVALVALFMTQKRTTHVEEASPLVAEDQNRV